MNVVDFSPLRGDPYAGALDPLIEAIEASKRRSAQQELQESSQRAQAERQQQELAQRSQVNDRLMARDADVRRREDAKQDLAERREAGTRSMANNKQRSMVEEQVRGDIAKRDFSRAEQRASSYEEQDPTTGEVKKKLPGFSIDRGGPRPSEPESPVEYGPQATPEIAQQAGLIRAAQSTPGDTASAQDGANADLLETESAESERKRFAQQNTPEKDLEFRTYQNRTEAWGSKQADPKLTDGSEIAPGSRENPDVFLGGVKTNADQMRYAGGRAAAEDFKKVGAVLQQQYATALQSGDPQALAAAERKVQVFSEMAPQVETGAVPVEKAMAALSARTSAEMMRNQVQEHDKTVGQYGVEKATIGAEAAAARSAEAGKRAEAGATRGDKGLDLKERQERSKNLRNDRKEFLVRFNAKTTQEAASEFPNIVKMLDSGNGKLQDQALITMMRLAQKDNRFSDADAKLAMRSGAGWLDQMENFTSKGIQGNYGDDVIAAAREAAKHLQGYYQAKSEAMNAEADSFLEQPDYYDPREAAQLLGRELPGFKERHPEFFQGGGGADRSRRASARPDPGNPDDPNASDAGRPLDGDRPTGGTKAPTQAMKDAAASNPKVRERLQGMGYQL